MSTKLFWSNGTEGPSHDPYYYEEFTVYRNEKKVKIHLGLAEWIEIDGQKIVPSKDVDIYDLFEKETGMNLEQFYKYYQKIRNRCKKCGCKKFK